MFDLTKPVQTRDGRAARIVSTALNSTRFKVGAIVTCSDNSEIYETYGTEGQYEWNVGEQAMDLINVPQTTTTYFNLGNGYLMPAGAKKVFPNFGVLKVVHDDDTGAIVSAEPYTA